MKSHITQTEITVTLRHTHATLMHARAAYCFARSTVVPASVDRGSWSASMAAVRRAKIALRKAAAALHDVLRAEGRTRT